MKKTCSLALLLALLSSFAPVSFAADTKVTALTADTAPTNDDLVMTVDDVAGTPTSKKVVLSNMCKLFQCATAATALTPGATVAITPGTTALFTLTPGEAETINATTTGAVVGYSFRLKVLTSGTSSYVLTFGSNFKSTGTLTTGTSDAKIFMVSFVWDGTNFVEISRTTAQ
jgi:hypothetical protein